MGVSFAAKVSAPPDVLVRELQGESVLLSLTREAYFGLDDVGTRMWEALTTSPSIDAAYAALLEEFDVAPEQLRADLEEFVGKLVAQGLLTVTDG